MVVCVVIMIILKFCMLCNTVMKFIDLNTLIEHTQHECYVLRKLADGQNIYDGLSVRTCLEARSLPIFIGN